MLHFHHVEGAFQRVPALRRAQLDRQYDAMVADLDATLHPYRDRLTELSRACRRRGAPRRHPGRDDGAAGRRTARWRDGYVSGAVYHGDPAHIDFLNRVYALNSQSNPLHFDLWPSTVKYEAEIVAMTAQLLGAGATPDPDRGHGDFRRHGEHNVGHANLSRPGAQ
jgi:sphinganine-1-phosphate aldolase